MSSIIDELHNDEGVPKDMPLITVLRAVVEDLTKAKKVNDRLQSTFEVGTPQWHACETIDDHLFEAFTKLGD